MTMLALGVLSVTCPVCRSTPGRRCVTKRGWAVENGAHHQRRALWLAGARVPA